MLALVVMGELDPDFKDPGAEAGSASVIGSLLIPAPIVS